MTNEQKQVKDWMTAFGQATPEKPTIPSLDVRKLRAKLIFEEAIKELIILGLGFNIKISPKDHPDFIRLTEFIDKTIEITFEDNKNQNLKDIADGCADLKVVTEGTLVACGLCQEPKRLTIDELELILKEGDSNPKVACNKANADPLFNEVMQSNWTKLWTTEEAKPEKLPDTYSFKQVVSTKDTKVKCWLIKDKDGKVIKSPSYKPANLQPIIDELNK